MKIRLEKLKLVIEVKDKNIPDDEVEKDNP
jgi:hypothetical protein